MLLCHFAFRRGPVLCCAVSVPACSAAEPPGLVKPAFQKHHAVSMWGWGAVPCLPSSHGALSHICPGPEVLHWPLSSSKVALISVQSGMCPWSACWLSAGGSHTHFCGESAGKGHCAACRGWTNLYLFYCSSWLRQSMGCRA